MGLQAYRSILALREVRRVLLLSLVVRIPMWAGNVILTLHVVSHLGRSYGAAGLLAAALTTALAISAPWRGRRLDRVGLRAAVGPSLVVLAVCWSIAPFVGYWPLLGLASLAGLFVVPSFSIVRQALLHSVGVESRKTVLSIDSVVIEVSFMAGPALGVLLASYWNTPWALFSCEFASIAGGLVLWFANPPLRRSDVASEVECDAAPTQDGPTWDGPTWDGPALEDAVRQAGPPRAWATPEILAVLLMSAAATLVLTGTDVGIVAALRHLHHQSSIGWVLAVWGFGSAVGGLVYGAMHRSVPVAVLLALLAATTIPVVLAREQIMMAVLLLVAGFFCAPTITASLDAISRLVPEGALGEAFGWHGSAMTIGSAAGAPIAGEAIDHVGWQGAFLLTAIVGLAAAGAGAWLGRAREGRPVAQASVRDKVAT